MPKVRTQADRRQHATVTDRHNRKFSVIIEKDTMHPCSTPVPKGWTPPKLFGKTPFLPPETYISYAPDDPFAMVIDYDTWIADCEREHASYEERISSAAIMQFGSGAARAVKERSPELLNYVGKAPMPIAPIKAARAGNLYVLGLSKNLPSWAVEYFTPPVVAIEEFPNAEDFPDVEEETVELIDRGLDEFPNVEEPADRELIDTEFDKLLTIEERVDPNATGGTSVDPRVEARRIPIEKPLTPKNHKAKAGK